MALGEHYQRNSDVKNAFHWYQNAAGKGKSYQSIMKTNGIKSLEGNSTAQAHVGIMYSKGEGVAKSKAKALNCLKMAASNGCNFARGHLAELLYGMKLYTEAVQYAKAAYDQYKSGNSESIVNSRTELEGVAISCYILGRCLTVLWI